MKLTVSREHAPPAQTTPAGLPDTSTQLATRHNAKLLWQACRARTAGSGTPNVRAGRPGVIVQLNVSDVMSDAWDGYNKSPVHAPSAGARGALYKYLRDAGDMVCLTRRAGDGSTWWIASEWQDKPHAGGTYTERKLTPGQAGEDREPAPVEIRYTCQYPDCGDPRAMLPGSIGRHLSTHGVTFEDYKKMIDGTMPWPGSEPAARESTEARETTHGSDDPIAAVEALVAEVKRLRALTSNSDLVEENKFLRAELDDVLARNAKLRQRLEAADKVLGRR